MTGSKFNKGDRVYGGVGVFFHDREASGVVIGFMEARNEKGVLRKLVRVDLGGGGGTPDNDFLSKPWMHEDDLQLEKEVAK